MITLALEFSSARRSVVLLELPEAGAPGAVRLLAEQAETAAREAKPLTLIERALAHAGLEAAAVGCIVVGTGPGSYTGIRSAIAIAQGWELARGVKLLGIPSADAIARAARESGARGRIAIAIDAQRGEFCLGVYECGEGGEELVEPLRIAGREEVERILAAGSPLFGPALNAVFPAAVNLEPSAVALGKLAAGRCNFLPGEKLEPVYLRETAFVKAPPPRNIS